MSHQPGSWKSSRARLGCMARKSVALLFFLVPAGITVAGGCSSNNDSASKGFIDEYCSLLVPCCGPGTDGSTPGSGCTSIYGFFTIGATYDGAKADACLSEIRTHKAEAQFCSQATRLAPSCDQVFRAGGTKQPGDSCAKSTECAPSNEGKVTCAGSVCQLAIAGKEGDQPCLGTVIGAITTDLPPPSKPIGRGFLCDSAKRLYCSKSGACRRAADPGAPCDTAIDSAVCGASARCDAVTKKCVAETRPTVPGIDSGLLLVCSSNN